MKATMGHQPYPCQSFEHHTVSQVYLTLGIKELIMTIWPYSPTEIPKWNPYCYGNTHLSPMTQKVMNEIFCYPRVFVAKYLVHHFFLPPGYIHDHVDWSVSSNPQKKAKHHIAWWNCKLNVQQLFAVKHNLQMITKQKLFLFALLMARSESSMVHSLLTKKDKLKPILYSRKY